MEPGQPIDLRLQGESFPGFFLIRLALNDGMVFVDDFAGGTALSSGEPNDRLRARLRSNADVPLAPHLRAASEREILARVLSHLKAIHWKAQDWPTAPEVVNRLVFLLPHDPRERMDRAHLFERLECPRAAARDLADHLRLRPAARDAAEVRGAPRATAAGSGSAELEKNAACRRR